MLIMSDQQAFESLRAFFEERPICASASDSLSQSVEIGVVINGNLECVFHKENGRPRFSQRPASKPDVVFHLNQNSIESLVNDKTGEIGELGINIVKSYLAGDIKIRVVGSMINLLTQGYLGVIKAGGISFAKFLASHGVNGLGKIKDVIQGLKSRK